MTSLAPIFTAKTQADVASTSTTMASKTTAGTKRAKNASASSKRKLALEDGSEFDLLGDLPLTPQILDALRKRVIELEDQIASSTSEPPAKRARVSAAGVDATEVSVSAAPTAASLKADEKKRKIQVKKIFDRLKKECKADGVKFQGGSKTIKFDEVFEVAEFESLFNGKGLLIQPTPTNKPKSTVTIMHFNAVQVNGFFGNELKGLKGNVWTRGGAPSFSKSLKVGTCDVSVHALDVNYSKNGMKCTLKFEVDGDTGGHCLGGRRSMGWFFDDF